MPDVSGLRLEQAIELLTSIGFEKLTIHITAPPRMRGVGYDSNSRVIRQTMADDDSVVLLVCNILVK